MTVSKDTIFAVMTQAMRTCRERDDLAGTFEALTGAIMTAAALRPDGPSIMRGCAEVLVAAATELERQRAQGTAEAPAGNSLGTFAPVPKPE